MNELAHLAEFRSALQDYRLSNEALQVLTDTKLVLLVGPTAAGRNTVINEMVMSGDYYHIVSDTTRELRIKDGQPIEQNGREYWFRSENEVLAELRKGEYMEAAIIHGQQVSGCNIKEVRKAYDEGKIAIKDIEPGGAHTVHELKPDTHIIFVLPPNFGEWQRRLQSRGHMETTEYRRRMESACKEFETGLREDYYQFLINDSTEAAMSQINQIAKQGKLSPELQQKGRELAESLLATTRAFIKTL